MRQPIEKGSVKFKAELMLEGSWGSRDLGKHESTMTLYVFHGEARGLIEWDIPALDTCEEIGLWFDDGGNLVDYDGIMGYLPEQAISLLKKYGFSVDVSEFNPDLVSTER